MKVWQKEEDIATAVSMVDKKNVLATLKLSWEVHCVECAMPECYSVCALYSARQDGHCERSAYGIYPNRKFKGHYNFGADVKFRKWGKIEANLAHSYRVNTYCFFGRLFNVNFLYKLLPNIFFDSNSNSSAKMFDEFLIECFSSSKTPFKLIFEHFEKNKEFRETKFRKDFLVKKGHNKFSIPFSSLGLSELKGYVYLYPEDTNTEKRIIFTWLDFVKLGNSDINKDQNVKQEKIKCVAWDLDNTLWRGTLIEDPQISLNPKAVDTIKWLDSRGIIQTIISKNDDLPCWEKIKEFKLDEYFIHPEINWEPKSKNLLLIAEKLNIGVENICIIDDSPFERDEIKSQLPGVRVYTEKDIEHIPKYSEFNVLVSEDSKNRRMQYLLETKRMEARNQFEGSYKDFLTDCRMEVEAFIPKENRHIDRCFELVQRSNQLNLSTIRYTKDEFRELLENESVVPIALNCKDKYGIYGIIGFSSIRMDKEHPFLENFVISCRVAQKMVEHTFINELCKLLKRSGYSHILVGLVVTAKNGPLIKVFQEFPFKVHDERDNLQVLTLNLEEEFNVAKIMGFKMDPEISFNLVSREH